MSRKKRVRDEQMPGPPPVQFMDDADPGHLDDRLTETTSAGDEEGPPFMDWLGAP